MRFFVGTFYLFRRIVVYLFTHIKIITFHFGFLVIF